VFSGRIQLIGRKGISVVSDIDDTIKDSNVLDHRELIANTFGREFRSVPGMVNLYQVWASKSDVVFHYVSGSPWQLYPSLSGFIQSEGFPPGTFHLRQFRLKDKSAVEFLENRTLNFKLGAIDRLMRIFPERRFILVGDSAEKDPEVYAQIAKRFPGQVEAILIRNVTEETRDSVRFEELFGDLQNIDLRIFRSTSELADFEPP
jgi:phosphatidate phosphatase APP1